MYDLKDICFVVDFDGFTIYNKFYIREMGYSGLTKDEFGSIRFNLSPVLPKISDCNEWKTLNYIKYNICALTFKPMPTEKDCKPYYAANDQMLMLYERFRTKDRKVVAFKGGYCEKNMLIALKIPYLNLEDFGCPKYDYLPETPIANCGYHIKIKRNVHCPVQETYAFKQWILLQYKIYDSMKFILNQYSNKENTISVTCRNNSDI